MKSVKKILCVFGLCVAVCFGGAGFESDNYLIWINSHCPIGSTTCTKVIYNQTSKSNAKTISINGGEPIVGNLSGNLIGYKFYDKQNNFTYELSMDLKGNYTLYIRVLDGKKRGESFSQESVKPIKEDSYNKKIAKLKK